MTIRYSLVLILLLTAISTLPATSLTHGGTGVTHFQGSGNLLGVLGYYDYDSDGFSEAFIFDATIEQPVKFRLEVYGEEGVELLVNLSHLITPQLPVISYYYSPNNTLYLASIRYVESGNTYYYILTVDGIDLVNRRIVYYTAKMLQGICSYALFSWIGLSSVYRMYMLYHRYLLINMPLPLVCSPVLYILLDTRTDKISYFEIPTNNTYFSYSPIASLIISGRVLSGGINPYPPISYGDKYIFIAVNGSVYSIDEQGRLHIEGVINTNKSYILIYTLNNQNVTILATSPIHKNVIIETLEGRGLDRDSYHILHQYNTRLDNYYNLVVDTRYNEIVFIRIMNESRNNLPESYFTGNLYFFMSRNDIFIKTSFNQPIIGEAIKITRGKYALPLTNKYLLIDINNLYYGYTNIEPVIDSFSAEDGVMGYYDLGTGEFTVINVHKPAHILRNYDIYIIENAKWNLNIQTKPLYEPSPAPIILFTAIIIILLKHNSKKRSR